MENKDIRWHQRFSNYQKALNQLTKFIEKGELNELEEQGLIQAFEYTHELAWNTLKDFLHYQGVKDIIGSRDASREAFANQIISNGEIWMEMIKSRNESSHTYNEAVTAKITKRIKNDYFQEFVDLNKKLEGLKNQNG